MGVGGVLLILAGVGYFVLADAETVGARIGGATLRLLGSAVCLAGMCLAAYAAVTTAGTPPALRRRSGGDGCGDVLGSVARREQRLWSRPGMLTAATVTATSEAPFHEVKAAIVRRIGQAETDKTLIEIGDDVMVTLCAIDLSGQPMTPRADRAILAVADGSSWWASVSLR